jgi:L-lactate dehydrogenase complex protein LldF
LGLKAWEFGNTHPLLFETGGKIASIAARTFLNATGQDKITSLPYPLSGWTDFRDFPSFAPQSFHDWWRENKGS